ncbi:MAG: hypothetical protein ACRC67_30175 [Inquilinus sp.]|uniref:hypothetical protein n=1 Tax=Inquilinus sp. TaxID=1932117 RepID=UPI003F32B565
MGLLDIYAGPPAPSDPLGTADRWDLCIDANRQWRWRRFARNNVQVGASHQGYWHRDDCVRNARRNGYTSEPPTLSDALAERMYPSSDPLGKNDTWGFYQDPSGDWRWWRNARNNERVGASSEGYRSHAYCVENAVRHGYVAP